jgi:murein DD-endopeptidase MepM/ murein hydrolase activator NlpD
MNNFPKQWLERYALPLIVLVLVLAVVVFGRSALRSSLTGPAAVSPTPATGSTAEADPFVPESADSALPPAPAPNLAAVPVLRDESIMPVADLTTFRGKLPAHQFQTYEVVRGDTPIRIAERFGIKAETLLGGNPRLSEEAGLLQVGDILLIMPIDGLLHDVRPGESVESVAEKYGVTPQVIIDYPANNLEFPYRLYPDSQVLVPGAVREVFKWDPPQLTSLVSSGGYWAGQARPLIRGTGTYIWPTTGRNISQVYWYAHQAIDIAIVEGTPIFASDTGTVTYAAWSPHCYGNLIVINHGNGAETFYAHLSSFNVVPGQIVYQGNVIGGSGNTGCSSGPHLHFELRINGNRDNPMWWLP